MDQRIAPDDGIGADIGLRMQHAARADFGAGADIGIRAYGDIFADLRSRFDHGGGMNAARHGNRLDKKIGEFRHRKARPINHDTRIDKTGFKLGLMAYNRGARRGFRQQRKQGGIDSQRQIAPVAHIRRMGNARDKDGAVADQTAIKRLGNGLGGKVLGIGII